MPTSVKPGQKHTRPDAEQRARRREELLGARLAGQRARREEVLGAGLAGQRARRREELLGAGLAGPLR